MTVAAPLSTPCSICNRIARHLFRRIRKYDIARCRACGVQGLEPIPSAETIQEIYRAPYFTDSDDGYRDYLEEAWLHRRIARQRLAALRVHKASGRLLDVGCAAGFLLDEARRAGFAAEGIEPCATIAGVARERLGLEVVVGDFMLANPSQQRFDVVTFNNVLAHLRDPAGALRKAQGLLKPGGLLVIETWDVESPLAKLFGRAWPLYTPPSVLHYFGRRTLPRLLERLGFDVVCVSRGSKPLSLASGFAILEHRLPNPLVARLRTLLTESPTLRRLTIPFGYGQLLTVYARRPNPKPQASEGERRS